MESSSACKSVRRYSRIISLTNKITFSSLFWMPAPPDDDRGSAIVVRTQEWPKFTLDLHLKIDGKRMQLEVAFVMVRALRSQFTKAQDSAGEATTLFEKEIAELFVRQFCQAEAREGMIDKHREMSRPH